MATAAQKSAKKPAAKTSIDHVQEASEHLRVDLGLRAVRAQGSTEALTHLSSEIRKRKAELTK